MGIHTKHTPELAAVICDRLAEGRSLRSICRDADIPVSAVAVRRWAMADTAGFASQYAQARDIGLDEMSDELLDISDNTEEGVMEQDEQWGLKTTRRDMIDHRRLKVDTRKWYLSKLAPKRYGDRLGLDHSGEINTRDTSLDDAQRAAKIAALFAAVRKRAEENPAASDVDDLL